MDPMAEETLLEAPDGATTADTATPAAKTEAATSTPATPGEGSIADTGGESGAGTKPDAGADDWRKAMAGDDADALKELSRYNTQADAAKALVEAKKALRKGDEGKIKLPGKDATPEELAEFNKTIGIPEKVDEYKITAKPPEGLEIGDADKAFLGGITEKLHAKGGWLATPDGINAAHDFYYEMMQENAAQMAAAAVTKRKENEAGLKNEWGSEFKINSTYAMTAMQSYAPKGVDIKEWLAEPMANGTLRGDDPILMKIMSAAGRATTEDPAFLATLNGESMSADAVQTKIDTIKGYRTSDPKKYDENFQELQSLLERQRRASTRAA
jgi:hypothetical protein